MSSLTAALAATAEPQRQQAAARHEALDHAARAFESLFAQMMIHRMRQAQLEEGFFGQGSGSAVYEALFEQHLADQLSSTSPFGIRDLLLRQWTGGDGPLDEARGLAGKLDELRGRGVYEAVAPPAVAGAGARPDVVVDRPSRPAADRVSRAFGWGTDPIDGRRRFHHGVDLPAATGTPVLAVAPGRVTTVRSEPGYGLHVRIDHGQGWATRYAHLSATEVQADQWIERGSVIGAVGRSGRATGSHLHFESRRGDRAVDPATAAPGPLRAQVLGVPTDEE